MKRDSLFLKMIILAVVIVICIALTLTAALVIGSMGKNIFDLSNINLHNAIPVLIVGGIISCFVIGIGVLVLSRSIFYKFKEYFLKDNGGDKQ